ncbi:MAG TPA: hypothetical protein VK465_01400 [Fibrobacteria bacterium]|nr:hypothetical protein [Fibrobacteria bacterium]
MLNPTALPLPSANESIPGSRVQNSPRSGKAVASAGSPVADSGPSSAFAYVREDLAIRYESKDGDVLEVRRTVESSVGYRRGGAAEGLPASIADGPAWKGEPGAGSLESLLSGLPEEAADKTKSALDWARAIGDELKKQQTRLLESLQKEGPRGEDGETFTVVGLILAFRSSHGMEGAKGAESAEAGGSAVPEYWNAENTSDRIVTFATSFAGIFGDSEFAKTITAAVAEGFAQAEGITGDLPGAAGELRQKTRDLTFGKLEKWLDAWEEGAYNQEAQIAQSEPALPEV